MDIRIGLEVLVYEVKRTGYDGYNWMLIFVEMISHSGGRYTYFQNVNKEEFLWIRIILFRYTLMLTLQTSHNTR